MNANNAAGTAGEGDQNNAAAADLAPGDIARAVPPAPGDRAAVFADTAPKGGTGAAGAPAPLPLGTSALLPSAVPNVPMPAGAVAPHVELVQASPAVAAVDLEPAVDLEAARAAAFLGRVQGVRAKFSNVRAHLVHAANGDVRALAAAVHHLADLIETEFNAAIATSGSTPPGK